MSSASDAFASPIEDRGVLFARLLMEDYGVLEDTVRSRRLARAKSSLDDCQIKGADRFVALQEVEKREVSVYDVDELLGTKYGAEKALVLSLRRQDKGEAEAKAIVARYDIISAAELARVLVGFKVRSEPAPAAGGESDPNPPGAGNSSSAGTTTAPPSDASSS